MDTTPEAVTLDNITQWAPNGSCQSLTMLRLDRIHPTVSGNKWFKLRYQIEAAIASGKTVLLTFGGGYSNHLLATAFAAKEHGLRSIGIVRGHYEVPTSTLSACAGLGMQLISSSQQEYSAESHTSSEALQEKFPEAFVIPEGGANTLGIRGAAEIASLVPQDATDLCVAVGTGTTLTGLAIGLPSHIQLHGFCAARQCDGAIELLKDTVGEKTCLIHTVDDPRFGRWKKEQIEFMQDFHLQTGIPLDVVYTGKMMQRLAGMLNAGYFRADSRIVCIHTGGLQGNPPGLFVD